MNTSTIVILAVVIVGVIVAAAVGVAVWFYLRNERSKLLRSRFGPEYGRTVRAQGDAGHAEKILQERQDRVARMSIKPLSEQQRVQFAREWEAQQARFVDQPREAVNSADRLITEIMRVRGYPLGDFEQRMADVSVDHPVVVENYRIAHAIAVKDQQGTVGTDELRQAMIHYRAMFADLLHDGGMTPVREVRSETKARVKEAGL